MKNVFLLVIPLLLSQCVNDDQRNNTEIQQIENFKDQIYRDANKLIIDALPDMLYSYKRELLRLLRLYQHNNFPLKPLPTAEYENNLKKYGLLYGAIKYANLRLPGITTYKDYTTLTTLVLIMVTQNKVCKITEKDLQLLLSIFAKYDKGPFPIQSISAKEIEDKILSNMIIYVARQMFNDIVAQHSKEKYDEKLKELEAEIDKKS